MIAPGRVREGDTELVRLVKALWSCNKKYCQNVFIYSQGPLKFSCASIFAHHKSVLIEFLNVSNWLSSSGASASSAILSGVWLIQAMLTLAQGSSFLSNGENNISWTFITIVTIYDQNLDWKIFNVWKLFWACFWGVHLLVLYLDRIRLHELNMAWL